MRKVIESSLSRLFNKMQDHDTGTITAYRDKEYDDNDNITHVYTYKENQARNRSLIAKLLNKGYLVTSVRGSYIENYGKSNAKEVGENTFFVEDYMDKETLKKDLIGLGQSFNQDSIMFIYKGGKQSDLIGTNKTGYPGYNKVVHYEDRKAGVIGQFMTKVGNRPFFFESIIKQYHDAQGHLGKHARFTIASMPWQELIKKGLWKID